MPIKTVLLILSSAAAGCTGLPPVPHHTQYGIYSKVNPPGFYGTDNETHAHTYREFTDPAMSGGQCLSAPDYKAFERWLDAVKEYAQQHCK